MLTPARAVPKAAADYALPYRITLPFDLKEFTHASRFDELERLCLLHRRNYWYLRRGARAVL